MDIPWARSPRKTRARPACCLSWCACQGKPMTSTRTMTPGCIFVEVVLGGKVVVFVDVGNGVNLECGNIAGTVTVSLQDSSQKLSLGPPGAVSVRLTDKLNSGVSAAPWTAFPMSVLSFAI